MQAGNQLTEEKEIRGCDLPSRNRGSVRGIYRHRLPKWVSLDANPKYISARVYTCALNIRGLQTYISRTVTVQILIEDVSLLHQIKFRLLPCYLSYFSFVLANAPAMAL